LIINIQFNGLKSGEKEKENSEKKSDKNGEVLQIIF